MYSISYHDGILNLKIYNLRIVYCNGLYINFKDTVYCLDLDGIYTVPLLYKGRL